MPWLFDLFSQDVTVKRPQRLAQRAANGKLEETKDIPTDDFIITAAVMPIISPNEMLLLPEGRREDKTIKLYSKTAIYHAQEGLREADTIVYDGSEYEVMKVFYIDNIPELVYYKAIATKDATR